MEIKAKSDDRVTDLELKGKELALNIARSGIVLLKNDGILPLAPCKIALFGSGARHTVSGGSGSGEVNVRHRVNFYEGLKDGGFEIVSDKWLDAYDAKYAIAKAKFISDNKKKIFRLSKRTLAYLLSAEFMRPEGDILNESDIAFSDTDVCIYLLSRQAGEGRDEKVAKGSYLLTDEESANIAFCAAHFKKFILVINTPFPIDMSLILKLNIGAIIYTGLLGMEGGIALNDIITGAYCPEGRLTTTWAHKYADYPSSNSFATTPKVYYKEGTLVGYKYFCTKNNKALYPFGYGLSYTSFKTQFLSAKQRGNDIVITVEVTNVGKCAGRDTVQIYARKTDQTLFSESIRLVGFAKTQLLVPNETYVMQIAISADKLSVFDIKTAETVIERGNYILAVGSDAQCLKDVLRLYFNKNVTVCKHLTVLSENVVSEIFEDKHEYVFDADDLPCLEVSELCFAAPLKPEQQLFDDVEGVDALALLCGAGLFGENGCFKVPGAVGHTTSKFASRGLKNLEICDGPAGLRLQRRSTISKKGKIKPLDTPMSLYDYLPNFIKKALLGDPKKEKILYQYVTGFPAASVLARTWDISLAYDMGEQVGREMQKFGVDIWLAPATNIIRDPLCGRNFEYYSEDPIVSGLFAANVCKGVQTAPGRYAVLKHCACNNQETDRYFSSSEVDEKTLRELYLKPFEIAVKESSPRGIMTAYNKINGVYCANNKPLIEGVLRDEWGFDGIIMTDWLATGKGQADECKAISSGVDIIMPGGKSTLSALKKGYKKGLIDKDMMRKAISRMIVQAKKN